MFHRTKKGPDKQFAHSDGCRIKLADPGVRIEWSYMGNGAWEAECVCGKEYFHEPAGRRIRLDPYDPATAHHLRPCEISSEAAPAMLRAVLKVVEKDSYWWVTCNLCEGGWQVPHYAAERVG